MSILSNPESPETPLHFAADRNRLDILEYLISMPTMSDLNLDHVWIILIMVLTILINGAKNFL